MHFAMLNGCLGRWRACMSAVTGLERAGLARNQQLMCCLQLIVPQDMACEIGAAEAGLKRSKQCTLMLDADHCQHAGVEQGSQRSPQALCGRSHCWVQVLAQAVAVIELPGCWQQGNRGLTACQSQYHLGRCCWEVLSRTSCYVVGAVQVSRRQSAHGFHSVIRDCQWYLT